MAKKEQNTEAPVVQKDDALFEALDKNKKKKRRKIIITVVAIVLVVAILAVIGVSFLQKQVREQFATTSGEVISYAVTLGSISTTVSGSGFFSVSKGASSASFSTASATAITLSGVTFPHTNRAILRRL